jgi:hypothetical protein
MKAKAQKFMDYKAKFLKRVLVFSAGGWIGLWFTAAWAVLPQAGGGSGLYQQQLESNQPNNITNPYIDGVVATFAWSKVEPKENDLHWEVIEDAIQPWVQAGKKVILGIYTASVGTFGKKTIQSTPEWVFSAGAAKMSVPDGTILPVYWDPIYLQKYENFVGALGKRYNGDPRIEFVRIGVGLWGEAAPERWFARPESAEIRERWGQKGYTPARWLETIEKVMATYGRAFQKTPCALMLSGIYGDRNGVFRIANQAVALGFYLEQNGLRADWKKEINTSAISKIFQQYKGKTKLALEAWGSTERSESFRTGEVVSQGTLLETVRVGIDYGADYLFLYPVDIAKADKRNIKIYDPSYEEALKYAFERLKGHSTQSANPKFQKTHQ